MTNSSLLSILIGSLLIACLQSAPVPGANDEFCEAKGLIRYNANTEYVYAYETNTLFHINDVSEKSKSYANLSAQVSVRQVSDCTYQLSVSSVTIKGESLDQDINSLKSDLESHPTQFRLNKLGQLDSQVSFEEGDDSQWSRNIKRGIVSSLQSLSACHLSNFDQDGQKKSSLVYETDNLGRCRTVYSTNTANYESGNFDLKKKKLLHTCTLSNNVKSTRTLQYVPYRNLPEFKQGRLFRETDSCNVKVASNVVSDVDCHSVSLFRMGSKGSKGIRVSIDTRLTLKSQSNTAAPATSAVLETVLEKSSIEHDFSDLSLDDKDYKDFDVAAYTKEICADLNEDGLDATHAKNFRKLVKNLATKNSDKLLAEYQSAAAACDTARQTYAQALLLADTENSLSVVLNLLDKDAFKDSLILDEYPKLTLLARSQNPSERIINKLKEYLATKGPDFPYYRKLSLVYSALINTHCKKNQCSTTELADWSAFIANNLGSDCSDSKYPSLVTTSVKALGNIGFLADSEILVNCATNKKNSLETRVTALQSLRGLECTKFNTKTVDLLGDAQDDSEVRINAFLALAKCTQGDEFTDYAEKYIGDFLAEENDPQVLTFIIDYAKEHGLTAFLNPILANPAIKEKFDVNFKELSWNNYIQSYSVLRDAGYEIETSVIYASRSFIPRSVRVNVTVYNYGKSINLFDITLRAQGLTDVLKAVFVDKISSAEFLKRIAQNPDKLIDILQVLADKLKYQIEPASLSLSVRQFGADVIYSELNEQAELQKLGDFLKNFRERVLYSQVRAINNYFLLDGRIRQALTNGFEFNAFFDLTAAAYVSKQSTKTDADDGSRTFSIKNLYSFVASSYQKCEVLVNPKNRLSLAKVALFNTRVNFNVEGNKKNGSATYKINLPDAEEKTLLSVESNFYKLVGNGKYDKIDDFTAPSYKNENCTSPKFHSSFGVDLCWTVKRPGTAKQGFFNSELLKDEDDNDEYDNDETDDNEHDHDHDDDHHHHDDDEDDNVDDHDDDDDHDHDHKKHHHHNHNHHSDKYHGPRLGLSGPVNYKIVLKNVDLVNKLVLQFTDEKTDETYELNGSLKTETKGYVQDRLELHYKKVHSDTNRGFVRSREFEVKVPATNEIRFRLATGLAYVKKERFNLEFNLENKILRELRLSLELKREKLDDNIIGNTKIEAVVDSYLRSSGHRYYHIALDAVPEGKHIKGNLIIERKDASTNYESLKVVDGLLTLTHTDNENDIDYDIDLNLEHHSGRSAHVHGHVAASLFDSNIDLTLESSRLNNQLSVRGGHHFDGSSKSKSYVEFNVKTSESNDKGLKVYFQADLPKLKLNYLEFQVRKSGAPGPSVFIGRSYDEASRTGEFELGVKNFDTDLSQGTPSSIKSSLLKLDGDKQLDSLVLVIRKVVSGPNNLTTDFTLTAEKNNKQFAKLAAQTNGCLTELRQNLNRADGEVPKQELSATVSLKALSTSGTVSGKLSIEASAKNAKHNFNFEFDADNLFRILIKVISIRAKFQAQGQQIDAQYQIMRLGDVRSMTLKTTNGKIRSSASGKKEFDISYEKKQASGTVHAGNGLATFTFNDLKNFEINFDVASHFKFNLVHNVQINNDLSLGKSGLLKINYAHLDVAPYAREFVLQTENVTDTVKGSPAQNTLGNFLFREGTPGKLNDPNELRYSFDLRTKNQIYFPNGKKTYLSGENSFSAQIKSLNFDVQLKSVRKVDLEANTIRNDVSESITFPTFVSDSGKSASLKGTLVYKKDLNTNKVSIDETFETDHASISKYVQKSTLALTREYGQNNLRTTTVNVDYSNTQQAAPKKFYIKLESDCLATNGKCKILNVNLKQEILKSFLPRFAYTDVETIEISDCAYARTYERIFNDQKKSLDTSVSLVCNGKTLFNNAILISRDQGTDKDGFDYPETQLKVEAQSDFYYVTRKVQLGHKKFSAQNGYVSLGLEHSDKLRISSKINYERKVDPATGDLQSGEYVLTTSTASDNKKECTLKVESTDAAYYNSFTCKLTPGGTPALPAITYGYNLKVDDIDDFVLGRRLWELTVNLPGRSLRFDYDGHVSSPLNSNNERELNGTFHYYWNYSKDKSQVLTINARRDNFAKGASKTKINLLFNGPTLDSINFEVQRLRRANETKFEAELGYNLKNGKTNKLDLDVSLYSDFTTNSYSVEANLARPNLNALFKSRFNKKTGQLQYSKFRAAKLLAFNVEKEADIRNRRISLELVNPSNDYQVERKDKFVNGVYTVESKLSQGGNVLSILTSKFDSAMNEFKWELDAVKAGHKYSLNFDIYNETVAAAQIIKDGNVELVRADVEVEKLDKYHNLVFNLKWNRIWSQLRADILGGANNVAENSKYNSNLGDFYAVLSDDLKPTVDNIKKVRGEVQEDIQKLAFFLIDFYTKALPSARPAILARIADHKKESEELEKKYGDYPLYKRVVWRYNNLAKKLTDLSLLVREYNRNWSRYVPRLPVIEYNSDQTDKSIRAFDNNLKVTRPMLNAHNLHQFYAEQRDYIRAAGNRIERFKGNLLRNPNELRIKTLINKYKIRSLSDYTLVGVVYNRRNIIALNGQSTIVKSKCRYLLTHELRRNQFSVILNNQDNSVSPVTVAAAGYLVDISYDKATVNGQQIALPHHIALEANQDIAVTKSASGICVRVRRDLKVCCHEDSKSCHVALTRWFSGKVDGLLGSSAHSNSSNFKEEYWYADSKCTSSLLELRKPKEEAVKQCYSIFGSSRWGQFSTSFSVIDPQGWRNICEQVLSNDPKAKCVLQRAYVHHCKIRSVEVDEPNECYSCVLNEKKFRINEKVPQSIGETAFKNGTDFVFLVLPCDKSISLENIAKVTKRLQVKNIRQYVIRVGQDTSLYQSAKGDYINTDLVAAYSSLTVPTTLKVTKQQFKESIYQALYLFSQRLVENRRLIIVSCGNCLPYSSFDAIKLAKELNKRNVVVSSWGLYEMTDRKKEESGEDTSEDTPIGYTEENVFLYNQSTEKVDTDSSDAFKIEHKGDLCSRLADKTDGSVFDLSHIKETNKIQQVIKKLEEVRPSYKQTVKRCERVDTPFGDIDDFKIVREKIEQ